MKRENVVMFILIFIVTFVLIDIVYSAFFSSTGVDTELDVGVFNVKINEFDIKTSNKLTLKDIVWENKHANSDTVAPGSKGVFYIEIDPNDADVAFTYSFSFIDRSEDPEKILTVRSIEALDSDLIHSNEFEYTGLFLLEDINNGKKHRIKVTVEWINNEEFNEYDTKVGLGEINPECLEFTILVKQYSGVYIESID